MVVKFVVKFAPLETHAKVGKLKSDFLNLYFRSYKQTNEHFRSLT